MADVHVVTAGVVVHNPGQHPLAPNAGTPVVVSKDTTGKTISTHGQVANTSVVFNSPA
jgi:hypothetical protein